MKKSILFTAAVVLLMGTFVKAQSMTQYTWAAFDTKFKIGSDMKVVESTSEKFEASGDGINLTLYPEKVNGLTKSKMKTMLQTWTESNGVKPTSDGYTSMKDLNGYWGEQVVGTKDGYAVYLMFLHDPNHKDIAMYIWVAYEEKTLDLAVSILTSFTPTK